MSSAQPRTRHLSGLHSAVVSPFPGGPTRPQRRLQAHELLQLFKTFFAQQFQKRPALASGDHQPVDVLELLWLFYQHNFGAQLFQPAAVGVEIALQRQDSYPHRELILPDARHELCLGWLEGWAGDSGHPPNASSIGESHPAKQCEEWAPDQWVFCCQQNPSHHSLLIPSEGKKL